MDLSPSGSDSDSDLRRDLCWFCYLIHENNCYCDTIRVCHLCDSSQNRFYKLKTRFIGPRKPTYDELQKEKEKWKARALEIQARALEIQAKINEILRTVSPTSEFRA